MKVLLGLVLGGALIYGQSIVTKIWVDNFESQTQTEQLVTAKTQVDIEEEETMLFSAEEGTIRHETIEGKHDLYVVEIEGALITFRPDLVQFTARDARGHESTVALRIADQQSVFNVTGINAQSSETVNLGVDMSSVLRSPTMDVTYFEKLQYDGAQDGTSLTFSVLEGDLIIEMTNQNSLPSLQAFWFRNSDFWSLDGEASDLRRSISVEPISATSIQPDADGTLNIQGSANTSAFKISL